MLAFLQSYMSNKQHQNAILVGVKVAIRNGDTVMQQEDSDILAINKIMNTLYVHTINYMYHYAYVYIYIEACVRVNTSASLDPTVHWLRWGQFRGRGHINGLLSVGPPWVWSRTPRSNTYGSTGEIYGLQAATAESSCQEVVVISL